jgi:hypothetical protein
LDSGESAPNIDLLFGDQRAWAWRNRALSVLTRPVTNRVARAAMSRARRDVCFTPVQQIAIAISVVGNIYFSQRRIGRAAGMAGHRRGPVAHTLRA